MTVVRIEGEVGTGKTSLALTFPEPIQHFDTDIGGFDRASWRFKDKIASGDIRSKSYHFPDNGANGVKLTAKELLRSISGRRAMNSTVGAKEIWNELFDDYGDALDDHKIRTVVFDSWTRVWRLCTSAYREEIGAAGLMPRDYGIPNNRMTALLDIGRKYGKHIVLVVHMDDEYKDVTASDGQVKSISTGRRVADKWKTTDNLVDMIIRTELNSSRPKATITQSKLVLDLTGMVYEEPRWEMVETAVRMLRGES